MNLIVTFIFLLCFLLMFSSTFTGAGALAASVLLIISVILIILILKRNSELQKHNLKENDSEKLIIQNVKAGGVIRILNLEGFDTDLDLKCIRALREGGNDEDGVPYIEKFQAEISKLRAELSSLQ